MKRLCLSFLILFIVLLGYNQLVSSHSLHSSGLIPEPEQYKGIVVSADQVNPATLENWKQASYSVALQLTTIENAAQETTAARQIADAGLTLEYWIEVGRCPELATEHPEWMASLQGHPAWRKLFPDVPQITDDQVIKNHPWVPILYQESFDAHLKRIETVLADKPSAQRLWLNDLQSGPSACGCGHPLCRWTADYGPIKTATPLDHRAAAMFVAAVKKLSTTTEVIPIFVGECEADDKATVCCDVNCFEGKCWREFSKQLDALAAESEHIGVGCFYRAFQRDLERYQTEAGWVKYTLKSFSELPPQRGGIGVATPRLIAVLQGWDVTAEQILSQQSQAEAAGAAGWLVVQVPIDQSWKPVVFQWK